MLQSVNVEDGATDTQQGDVGSCGGVLKVSV